MAALSEKKIAEGKEFLKEAEKCLKTGLLKWKPDYEGAAMEFGKAAVAFKNGKAYDQAIASYMKQADMLKQTGSIFHAAKAVESAGMLSKESGDLNKAVELIEQASTMYLEHGTPDTAAIVLDRAAKMVEQALPERAIQLYLKACDVSEAEDRPKQSAEMVGRAGRVLIRMKRYEEAADAVNREINYLSKTDHAGQLNKLVMALVLIHLNGGDYVAADQAFQRALRLPGVAESEEASPIEQLLEAYDDRDQEAAEQIARGPLFRYMENDFTKLARDLRVPAGGSKRQKSNGASSANALPSGEAEEDPYGDDGGLL